MISVGGYKLFTARSTDRGKSWIRREWVVPGMAQVSGNRPPTFTEDGAILYHVYTTDTRGDHYNYVWRSTDGGGHVAAASNGNAPAVGVRERDRHGRDGARLRACPPKGRWEAIKPAREVVRRRRRYLDGPAGDRHLGYPAHLLRLRDGRILCAFGYRREPGGVRAVLSEDGGRTWDLDRTVVLRGRRRLPQQPQLRGGHGWGGDVGYPVSVQLPDDSILTAYYITESDGITPPPRRAGRRRRLGLERFVIFKREATTPALCAYGRRVDLVVCHVL